MSTLFLPAGGREQLNWSIDGVMPGDNIEVSFDYGVTWTALTYDGDAWSVWVAGPQASAQAGDVILGDGLFQTKVRKQGAGVLLRDAGLVQVQSDCPQWPVDWSCWSGDALDTDTRERAETLAVQTLRLLTNGMVGNCPVTIDVHGHGGCHYQGFTPHLFSGVWRNDDPCGRFERGRLILPGPIQSVEGVTVDGETVDPSLYRIDGWALVHRNGRWPSSHMQVTYTRGFAVDYLGATAAGMLASEYALACLPGKKCALPRGVTSMVRQGVTIEITQDMFADGLTGVRSVDAYTARYNSYRQQSLPTIYSPDLGW